MEVLFAENLGFCYGVKRAIQMAENAGNEEGPSYTLGPIIHNPQMVDRLAEKGVEKVDSLDEVDRGTIIVRSHGVGPNVYDAINDKGLNLVDATCPHVRRAQQSAKLLSDEQYQVVVIGDKNHPEVRSILEWAGEASIVVDSEEMAENISKYSRIGVVSQTTFSGEKFKRIVMKLLDKSAEVKVLRTICTATDQRQKAAVKLADQVDLMLVIGGRNSANTTKLAQLCQERCKTYHIETAQEVCDEWFATIKKIGITAGASTPDWIIKEVYEKCQKK